MIFGNGEALEGHTQVTLIITAPKWTRRHDRARKAVAEWGREFQGIHSADQSAHEAALAAALQRAALIPDVRIVHLFTVGGCSCE